MNALKVNGTDMSSEVVEFARELVRIQSLSGQEGELAQFMPGGWVRWASTRSKSTAGET